jgi:hypothetical protein
MTLKEDLFDTEATKSPQVSFEIFNDIYKKEDWRLYTSVTHVETESLINRFLNSHAQIPGGLSETLPGFVPMAVIRFGAQERLHEALIYINGAVMFISDKDYKGAWFLFVSDTTAQTWGYSPNYLNVEERMKTSSQNKET